jgi:YD repeat-containing protein
VEPDEIDYDSETATTEYDDAGNLTKQTDPTTASFRRCVFPYCGGVQASGSSGGSTNATTYGPVITVKPKG